MAKKKEPTLKAAEQRLDNIERCEKCWLEYQRTLELAMLSNKNLK